MLPTILNTFYWALRGQRLHSRPFLRPDQSRGLPHLSCLLLNSVLLRSMPVGKLSSECNTSKFPFFRKFGINNYSEYSDLIFQQFCKGLYFLSFHSLSLLTFKILSVYWQTFPSKNVILYTFFYLVIIADNLI